MTRWPWQTLRQSPWGQRHMMLSSQKSSGRRLTAPRLKGRITNTRLLLCKQVVLSWICGLIVRTGMSDRNVWHLLLITVVLVSRCCSSDAVFYARNGDKRRFEKATASFSGGLFPEFTVCANNEAKRNPCSLLFQEKEIYVIKLRASCKLCY